jgi:orotate phosphoribosyltransferase
MYANDLNVWMIDQLNKFNAVIAGSHLVLTSGKHSNGYINLRMIAGHTDVLYSIGEIIATLIIDRENELGGDTVRQIIVVGPETMGRTLAEFTAIAGSFNNFAWCDMKKDQDGDYAEWSPKLNFSEIINGARCYIVDDLLTTGKSLIETKLLIEKSCGEVAGAIVVVRRDKNVTTETIDIPWLYTLLDADNFETHEADLCPMCAAEVPMRLRPGHGHEWAKNHESYPTTK